MIEDIKLPNLFIVGDPHSGTTSLYNYLKQNPEVFISLSKNLITLHEKIFMSSMTKVEFSGDSGKFERRNFCWFCIKSKR
jgi:hypothetical protein